MQHLIGRYGNAARRRRALLQPRQRADAVGRHAPRRPPRIRPATTSCATARSPTPPRSRRPIPTAETLGPAEWGWSGYFWSALDAAPGGAWWNNPQDRLAHGNVPLVEWYLQQLQAYEQQHGTRLLDYLDLHYYPQASRCRAVAAPATPPRRRGACARRARCGIRPTSTRAGSTRRCASFRACATG